jgi:hypothetical protein
MEPSPPVSRSPQYGVGAEMMCAEARTALLEADRRVAAASCACDPDPPGDEIGKWALPEPQRPPRRCDPNRESAFHFRVAVPGATKGDIPRALGAVTITPRSELMVWLEFYGRLYQRLLDAKGRDRL